MLLAVIAFIAGVVQGMAGFGFTLVLSPVCAFVLPSHAVVGTVARCALIVDLLIAKLDGKGVDRGLLASYAWPAMLAVPVAIVLGNWIGGTALALMGGVITLGSTVLLIRRSDATPVGSRAGASTAGFASGVLGITTGLSGPPLAVHVARSGADPGQTRGTLAWLFVGIDGLAVLSNRSSVGVGSLALIGVAALAGTLTGRRFDGVFGDGSRRRASAVLIGAAGSLVLASVVW